MTRAVKQDSREQLARDLLGGAYGALTPIQRSVIDLIATEAPPSLDTALQHDDRPFADRLADQIAAIGGSWGFIIGFCLALALWMGWNLCMRGLRLAFDPYPFTFLNLVLSTLAAIQAPIIIMSQNRSAARDRANAEHDYIVNLRAELKIMRLQDKIDTLRRREMLGMIRRQNETLRILRDGAGPSLQAKGERPAPPAQ